MPHRRPHGHQCLNIHNGKVSHILLKRSIDFPHLGTGSPPPAGTIIGATCTDDDNSGLTLTATPIHQGANATTTSRRLGIKILVQGGGGGGGPLDGLLTITLQIADGFGGMTNSPPIDVPIDYVDDPTAP